MSVLALRFFYSVCDCLCMASPPQGIWRINAFDTADTSTPRAIEFLCTLTGLSGQVADIAVSYYGDLIVSCVHTVHRLVLRLTHVCCRCAVCGLVVVVAAADHLPTICATTMQVLDTGANLYYYPSINETAGTTNYAMPCNLMQANLRLGRLSDSSLLILPSSTITPTGLAHGFTSDVSVLNWPLISLFSNLCMNCGCSR